MQDYYGVNPEFGTMEDLRHFVDAAHDLGMHVILDWVANHTAWTTSWSRSTRSGTPATGRATSPDPVVGLVDIIDLDYDNEDLRHYMADAMAYWVREAGIDGYRCDVAGFVPTDFWEEVRREPRGSSPSSCWPSGRRATCTPAPST